mmetsp:Transcript_10928/g.12047  ORF Transcript_10928/g.12047 Transcript_10928/m.12047 type:complete len:123 (+) Transcript_10928:15-383(+)
MPVLLLNYNYDYHYPLSLMILLLIALLVGNSVAVAIAIADGVAADAAHRQPNKKLLLPNNRRAFPPVAANAMTVPVTVPVALSGEVIRDVEYNNTNNENIHIHIHNTFDGYQVVHRIHYCRQ